jgi:hypothetical protein
MRIGIKYCGGCNPGIERMCLVEGVMHKLPPQNFGFEFFDFNNCDVVLVVNGCRVACAEIPINKKIITVSGSSIDGWIYDEKVLVDEIVKRLFASAPQSFTGIT